MIDGQRIHREARLELRELIEIIDDYLRNSIPLQLDHHPGILIRFIANAGDVRDDFFVHQFRNALHQHRPIDVIGNLRDDDLLAPTLKLLDPNFPADLQAAFPAVEVFLDRLDAADHAAGGKVRTFDELHQLRHRNRGIINLSANSVDYFAQIMRGHVRRHAHGDTGAAIDEQIGKCRRKNYRFAARLVVVRDEIDGVLFHVLHEEGSQVSHPGFRIPHGRRRVPFDGAEISLAIDQTLTHRPRLCHVNERRIDSLIAMRMVVAHRFSHDLGAFEMLAIGINAQIIHREENPALRRLESITRIRKRARDDYGH